MSIKQDANSVLLEQRKPKAKTSPKLRIKRFIKKSLITGYCYGVIPDRWVSWAFKKINLRDI